MDQKSRSDARGHSTSNGKPGLLELREKLIAKITSNIDSHDFKYKLKILESLQNSNERILEHISKKAT
jgi:hypothetical protein